MKNPENIKREPMAKFAKLAGRSQKIKFTAIAIGMSMLLAMAKFFAETSFVPVLKRK